MFAELLIGTRPLEKINMLERGVGGPGAEIISMTGAGEDHE